MQVTLNAAGANMNITMTPINPPIIIPPTGGSFQYTITVSNNGTGSVYFDCWIMLTLPGGTNYGPLVLRSNLYLTAGASISRTLTQTVPANAPPGEYYFQGLIGDYPPYILEQDGFNFTKQN
jgi:hypothetical protein